MQLALESRMAIDQPHGRRRLPFPNPSGEPRFRLRLLGDFDLKFARDAISVSAFGQRLIAYLAIEQRPIHRSHVAGVFWPDVSEGRARGNLRN